MKLLKGEVGFLILYAAAFYAFIIHRSLQLSRDHHAKLFGLRPGWLIPHRLNDVSDAQWRNFRGNFPVLTGVFTMFTLIANLLRTSFHLKARGMSIIWILISFTYLAYLHGACLEMGSQTAKTGSHNYQIQSTYFMITAVWSRPTMPQIGALWIRSRVFVLRMISFGYDYHWAHRDSRFDHKKHIQHCNICKSGKTCYHVLQERGVQNDMYALTTYLAYLVYAPLYLTGPIVSFNAFASQLDVPQNNFSAKDIAWYGLRWVFSLLLMELMTHLFYYNAFAISGMWKELYPMDVFIIGYGVRDDPYSIKVLIFMWLKFFLIWRYFRFWSLICGIEVPENMPRCINNCYNLETFWKNWHASYNKWLVRYLYIPLGGTRRKLLNVWVVFTFVAIWHDLEWKLLSWAWLTCLFFIPEMILKSATNAFQVKSTHGEFVVRELSAVAGAITITCLMVANLVGFVIGPSGISWLISQFLKREGLPVLAGMLLTFYVGTKVMSQLSAYFFNGEV
ncbi:hypothetical protein C1H46_006980 [Malus baccata]|uniref:Membrane-bound O-acyltransferase C24H6.01c n=1 Tax=Malus baccata TaxID=106549 RepID=A0A540N8F6_MALBA|nr:hypothetical protein C1H46_006980 [Malus baccata]